MAESGEGLWMSAKERDRLKVLHEVKKGHITQKQGAAELGLSVRWVRKQLMLLMLKVATLTKCLSLPVPLGAPRKRSNRVLCSGWHYLTDGKRWKTPN